MRAGDINVDANANGLGAAKRYVQPSAYTRNRHILRHTVVVDRVQWTRNSYLDCSICLAHKVVYGESSQVRSPGRKDCEIGG